MFNGFLAKERSMKFKQLIVATAGAWFGGTVLTLVDVWAGAITGALAGAAAIYLGFLYKPKPRERAVPESDAKDKEFSRV